MTQNTWEKLRYGYSEDGNTLEAKGGYTVEQFEIMEEQMNLFWAEYRPCEIKEFEIISK